MGNSQVHASSQSKKPSTPLLPSPPIEPIPVDPYQKPQQTTVDPLLGLTNPGPLEELHKKCKELFPINFEGAKICIQKGLSNHFQVSHSVNLGGPAQCGYRFGATYVGMHQFGPSESYPVLMGDIDPSGNLTANVYHKFTNSLLTKVQAAIQSNAFSAFNVITDYKGPNYTATLSLISPNIIQDSGIAIGHYLQSVTKNLAMGAELVYQRSRNIPGHQIAVISMACRYTGDDYTVSGTVGGTGLHVCYYQKASEQLQLGVMWENDWRIGESVTSLGYQIDLPKADLVFKGMMDSNWNVGATLDKKLTPMPFSLTLSGILNHQKNNFRLGLGFILGN